jgi:HSP20 family protein
MTRFTISRKPYQRPLNNLVDELFNDLSFISKSDFNKPARNESVPVNVKETGNAYRIEVIAPGFEKGDFSVNIEQDLLTISVEKQPAYAAENEKVLRKEYVSGSFKRSFTIDEKIDATKIEASYVNGVLVLDLPKKEEVREPAKQIEIK